MSQQVSAVFLRASRRRPARGGTRRRREGTAGRPPLRTAGRRTRAMVSRTAPGFDVAAERREDLAARRRLLARVMQVRESVVRSCAVSLSRTWPTVIVVHAPTWMRSPSASGVSSPFPNRSSLSLRLVPLVDPRSVTVRPESSDLQDGVLRRHAAVGRVDAEVDAGLDALVAVAPADQGVVLQRDSAFREDLRELDGVGSAAGDDALVVLPVGGDDGGPLDRPRLRPAARRGAGSGSAESWPHASQKRPLTGALHAGHAFGSQRRDAPSRDGRPAHVAVVVGLCGVAFGAGRHQASFRTRAVRVDRASRAISSAAATSRRSRAVPVCSSTSMTPAAAWRSRRCPTPPRVPWRAAALRSQWRRRRSCVRPARPGLPARAPPGPCSARPGD